MTKTTFVRLAAAILAVFMLVTLVACSDPIPDTSRGDDNMAKLTYPDFPDTPSDKNSWEYIEDGTDITIDWYVDVSTWNAPTGVDAISKKIKEDTGIICRRPSCPTPSSPSATRKRTLPLRVRAATRPTGCISINGKRTGRKRSLIAANYSIAASYSYDKKRKKQMQRRFFPKRALALIG